ncbi:hypothetical protein ACSBR2_014628 [Camellia fascicularis]
MTLIELIGIFYGGILKLRKKVHLVNWDNVCKSKAEGGLGLRKARDQNTTLLIKLGWKILSDKDKLWCKVLHSKYLKHHNIYTWPMKKNSSHCWRSICKHRDVLRKGVKWIVGNGKDISFWTDWWCGKQPLSQHNNTSQIDNTVMVNSVLDDEGNWDTNILFNLVSQQDLNEILKIYRPRFVTFPDAPTWVPSHTGNFTSASTFNFITDSDLTNRDWKWIWKIKIPQKLRFFLWLILKGRLLTNQLRLVKHLAPSDICPRCGQHREDMKHLLRDCPTSKDIWTHIQNLT